MDKLQTFRWRLEALGWQYLDLDPHCFLWQGWRHHRFAGALLSACSSGNLGILF